MLDFKAIVWKVVRLLNAVGRNRDDVISNNVDRKANQQSLLIDEDKEMLPLGISPWRYCLNLYLYNMRQPSGCKTQVNPCHLPLSHLMHKAEVDRGKAGGVSCVLLQRTEVIYLHLTFSFSESTLITPIGNTHTTQPLNTLLILLIQ